MVTCGPVAPLADQLAELVWSGIGARADRSGPLGQRPPDTVRICPVTQLPASLAR